MRERPEHAYPANKSLLRVGVIHISRAILGRASASSDQIIFSQQMLLSTRDITFGGIDKQDRRLVPPKGEEDVGCRSGT